jgi:YqjK-like protein
MSIGAIELALKKQRLTLKSAALRERWATQSLALHPVCRAGDGLYKVVAWLRRHPQTLVAGSVALVVARPRSVARWAKRTIFAWRSWRRLRGWLGEGQQSG